MNNSVNKKSEIIYSLYSPVSSDQNIFDHKSISRNPNVVHHSLFDNYLNENVSGVILDVLNFFNEKVTDDAVKNILGECIELENKIEGIKSSNEELKISYPFKTLREIEYVSTNNIQLNSSDQYKEIYVENLTKKSSKSQSRHDFHDNYGIKSYKFKITPKNNLNLTENKVENYQNEVTEFFKNKVFFEMVEIQSEGLICTGWNSIPSGHLITMYYHKKKENEYNVIFFNSGSGINKHFYSEDKTKYSVTYLIKNVEYDTLKDLICKMSLFRTFYYQIEKAEDAFYSEIVKIFGEKLKIENEEEYEYFKDSNYINDQLSGSCAYYGLYYAIKFLHKKNKLNFEILDKSITNYSKNELLTFMKNKSEYDYFHNYYYLMLNNYNNGDDEYKDYLIGRTNKIKFCTKYDPIIENEVNKNCKVKVLLNDKSVNNVNNTIVLEKEGSIIYKKILNLIKCIIKLYNNYNFTEIKNVFRMTVRELAKSLLINILNLDEEKYEELSKYENDRRKITVALLYLLVNVFTINENMIVGPKIKNENLFILILTRIMLIKMEKYNNIYMKKPLKKNDNGTYNINGNENIDASNLNYENLNLSGNLIYDDLADIKHNDLHNVIIKGCKNMFNLDDSDIVNKYNEISNENKKILDKYDGIMEKNKYMINMRENSVKITDEIKKKREEKNQKHKNEMTDILDKYNELPKEVKNIYNQYKTTSTNYKNGSIGMDIFNKVLITENEENLKNLKIDQKSFMVIMLNHFPVEYVPTFHVKNAKDITHNKIVNYNFISEQLNEKYFKGSTIENNGLFCFAFNDSYIVVNYDDYSNNRANIEDKIGNIAGKNNRTVDISKVGDEYFNDDDLKYKLDLIYMFIKDNNYEDLNSCFKKQITNKWNFNYFHKKYNTEEKIIVNEGGIIYPNYYPNLSHHLKKKCEQIVNLLKIDLFKVCDDDVILFTIYPLIYYEMENELSDDIKELVKIKMSLSDYSKIYKMLHYIINKTDVAGDGISEIKSVYDKLSVNNAIVENYESLYMNYYKLLLFRIVINEDYNYLIYNLSISDDNSQLAKLSDFTGRVDYPKKSGIYLHYPDCSYLNNNYLKISNNDDYFGKNNNILGNHYFKHSKINNDDLEDDLYKNKYYELTFDGVNINKDDPFQIQLVSFNSFFENEYHLVNMTYYNEQYELIDYNLLNSKKFGIIDSIVEDCKSYNVEFEMYMKKNNDDATIGDIIISFPYHVSEVGNVPLLIMINIEKNETHNNKIKKVLYIDEDDEIEILTDENNAMHNRWINNIPCSFMTKNGKIIYLDIMKADDAKDILKNSPWGLSKNMSEDLMIKFEERSKIKIGENYRHYFTVDINYNGMLLDFKTINSQSVYLFYCILLGKEDCLHSTLDNYLLAIDDKIYGCNEEISNDHINDNLVLTFLENGICNSPFFHYYMDKIKLFKHGTPCVDYTRRKERFSYFGKYDKPKLDEKLLNLSVKINMLNLEETTSIKEIYFDNDNKKGTFSKTDEVNKFINMNVSLDELFNKLNFTHDILNLITDNYEEFYKVIESKLVNDNLKLINEKLKNEVNKNDAIGLELLREFEKINSEIIYTDDRSLEMIIVEIFSGFFIKKQQFEIFKTIQTSIDSNLNKTDIGGYPVNQLLMGKGKSSVIMPLITFYYNLKSGRIKDILLVVPNHLLRQTYQDISKKYYNIISKSILKKISSSRSNNVIINSQAENKKRIFVIDDASLKTMKLNSLIEEGNYCSPFNIRKDSLLNNTLAIFDEIDSIYDPMTSNLNYPTNDDKSHSFIHEDISDDLLKKMVDLIFEAVNDDEIIFDHIDQTKIGDNIGEYLKDSFKLIKNTLKKCDKMIFNKDYGFPRLMIIDEMKKTSMTHNESLFAVPYNAVNSPVMNSNFSDPDITFILTVFSYLKNDIREFDVKKVVNNIKDKINMFEKIFSLEMINSLKYFFADDLNYLNEKDLDKFLNFDTEKNNLEIKKIVENLNALGDETKLKNKKYYVKNYVYRKIKTPKTYHNINAIDILYGDFINYKCGFSGTVNIKLPYLNNDSLNNDSDKPHESIEYNYKFNSIKSMAEDNDNIKKVIETGDELVYLDDEKKNNLTVLLKDTIKQLQENGCDVLIDTGAFFINVSSFDLIKNIAENLSKKYYIFIDQDDNKLIYDKTKKGTKIYDGKKMEKDSVFIYYDQKHTVGIDIPQVYDLKGLATVSSFNKLTDVSQGIYRLRHLGHGQKINFMILKSMNIKNRSSLYSHLEEKDKNLLENAVEIKKLEQNILFLKKNEGDVNSYLLTKHNPYDKSTIEDYIKNIEVKKKFEDLGKKIKDKLNDLINKMKNSEEDSFYAEKVNNKESEKKSEKDIQQTKNLKIEFTQNKIKELSKFNKILNDDVKKSSSTKKDYLNIDNLKRTNRENYNLDIEPDNINIMPNYKKFIRLTEEIRIYFSPFFHLKNMKNVDENLNPEFNLRTYNFYYIKIEYGEKYNYVILTPDETELLGDNIISNDKNNYIVKNKNGNIISQNMKKIDKIFPEETLVQLICGKKMNILEYYYLPFIFHDNGEITLHEKLNFILNYTETYYGSNHFDVDLEYLKQIINGNELVHILSKNNKGDLKLDDNDIIKILEKTISKITKDNVNEIALQGQNEEMKGGNKKRYKLKLMD